MGECQRVKFRLFLESQEIRSQHLNRKLNDRQPINGVGTGRAFKAERIRMAKDTGIQVGMQIREIDKPHPRALSEELSSMDSFQDCDRERSKACQRLLS